MSASRKLVAGLLFVLFLAFQPFFHHAHAEYKEQSLQITISQYNARVVEQISPRTIVSTIGIHAISDKISHIVATDQDNIVLAASQEGDMITIDTLGASHVTLIYDAGIISKNSGVWQASYNDSSINSTVTLPPASDIVSVNNIPNDISGNVISMPAGQVSISYVTRTVSENTFAIMGNGTTSNVDVLSASKIERFSYDGKAGDVTFKLDEQAPVLVIFSKTLLGDRYDVTLNGGPVKFREYYQNATHEWMRIDPQAGGVIKIESTTFAVPEFLFMSVPLLAVAMTVSLAVMTRKLPKA